jgi:hypothetical protein
VATTRATCVRGRVQCEHACTVYVQACMCVCGHVPLSSGRGAECERAWAHSIARLLVACEGTLFSSGGAFLEQQPSEGWMQWVHLICCLCLSRTAQPVPGLALAPQLVHTCHTHGQRQARGASGRRHAMAMQHSWRHGAHVWHSHCAVVAHTAHSHRRPSPLVSPTTGCLIAPGACLVAATGT